MNLSRICLICGMVIFFGLPGQVRSQSPDKDYWFIFLESGKKTPDDKTRREFLQSTVDKGTVGAWYTLESGPVAEILFARTTDTAMLEEALSGFPGAASKAAVISIRSQWLSKGVVH